MPRSTPERKPKPPGRNVEEWERGTVRVRLPRAAHARALAIAERRGCDVVQVIVEAIEALPER